MFEEYIVETLVNIFTEANNIGSGILIESPALFKGGIIYEQIKQISADAIMPISYVVLTFLFILEMQQITVRNEGLNSTNFLLPFKALAKILICKIVVDNTPLILDCICAISTELINNMQITVDKQTLIGDNLRNSLTAVVGNMSWYSQMALFAEVFLFNMLFALSSMMITVILYGRLIQIYVYMAIAALPLATLPNAEMSSIAKNFLKSFTAVCLQGVLIFIVVRIFGGFIQGIDFEISQVGIHKALLNVILYLFLLISCIFMTGQWSKSICNAM